MKIRKLGIVLIAGLVLSGCSRVRFQTDSQGNFSGSAWSLFQNRSIVLTPDLIEYKVNSEVSREDLEKLLLTALKAKGI